MGIYSAVQQRNFVQYYAQPRITRRPGCNIKNVEYWVTMGVHELVSKFLFKYLISERILYCQIDIIFAEIKLDINTETFSIKFGLFCDSWNYFYSNNRVNNYGCTPQEQVAHSPSRSSSNHWHSIGSRICGYGTYVPRKCAASSKNGSSEVPRQSWPFFYLYRFTEYAIFR